MFDIDKFKKNFNDILDSPKVFLSDPIFKVYNQFFSHKCASEVDFSCFTLEEAESSYEELCGYATEEDLDYGEDEWANEGNSFHEFCKIDDLFWSEVYSLPAKNDVEDYF